MNALSARTLLLHALKRPLLLVLWVVAMIIQPTRGWAQDGLREEVKHVQAKLTKPPQLIKFVEARYPDQARDKGIQGSVRMRIDLDQRGQVTKVEILESPDPSLAEAATVAVKQFSFSPAEVNNQPAPVRIEYVYNFSLGIAFNPRLPDWMTSDKPRAQGDDILVGKVHEQGSRIPLIGVAVAISDLGVEVKTDNRGQFRFKEIPPGTYTVQAISPEHKPEQVAAVIEKDKQTQIEFYLPPLEENPYEIVVRGTRRKTVVTRVTLREKELTTVPGTFGDPIRVVENMPGVARLPYVGGALLIRGAPPQDSGVFLDGIKIPLLYHFLGGPSVLNPAFLDRIDYYPGNVDVRYGRLLAGVVDVSTKGVTEPQWSGAADINLLNTSLLLKVPVTDKISVAGAVRRSYIDAILPTLLKVSDRKATTVVPVYYDYQLRVDVDLAGDDQLFFLVFGSDDSLDIVTNEPEDPVDISLDSRISFHRLLARWLWHPTSRISSRLTPSVGIDYVNFDTGTTAVNLRTIDFSLREDLELKLSRRATLRAGADLEVAQEQFDAEIPFPADYRNPGSGIVNLWTEDTEPLTLSQMRLGLGLYTDAILNLTSRWQVIPGARFELYRIFGHTMLDVEPRLTTRLSILSGTTLKGAAGLYSQAPQPREVSDEFGNPNLGLEHAAHFSAGFEQRLLPALNLDVQLYYLHRYSMIVPTKAAKIVGDTVQPLRYANAGNGYSYGMELLLKHDVTKHFYGWLAYTLSRTRVQREPDGEYLLFTFDQTHILTLVASVRLGVGWEVGTRFRLVSGRPDTLINGSVFDSDRNRYLPNQGPLLGERFPVFHQLDFRIEKTWFFQLWRLSAYLDIQNIYNAENPEATLYDYRYQESAPLRGLPILPTLGIKGSF